MKLPYVFISYARKDGSVVAEALEARLQYYGIGVFFDRTGIPPGEEWRERIRAEMARATHVICLLTDASSSSKHVAEELNLITRQEKMIVQLAPRVNVKPGGPEIDFSKNHTLMEDLVAIGQAGDVPQDRLDDIVRRLLQWYRLAAGGILPVKLLRLWPERIPHIPDDPDQPGEQIAAEILYHDLILSRSTDGIKLAINRRDVQAAVISNVGKRTLCAEYVGGERLTAALKLDEEIHTFMCRRSEHASMTIRCRDYPFRWASGGVLPIVEFEGREWVQLFYRDIRPSGWNLSLGSTERHFKEESGKKVLDPEATEKELTRPWNLICREFLEETLVLENPPALGRNGHQRPFDFGETEVNLPTSLAGKFSQKHRQLRRDHDHLKILVSQDDEQVIPVREDHSGGVTVVIELEDGTQAKPIRHILVAISPTELGIELIKPIRYKLDKQNYLLDGEMYFPDEQAELVRMPVGLISMDYVKRVFGRGFQLQYSEGELLPSVVGAPFEDSDVHVFDWDLNRRRELAASPDATEWERRRYTPWEASDECGPALRSGDKSRFPCLFTPATAKILHYFVTAQR